MHFFASHLRPGQQTAPSLRAAQYKSSNKRKRDDYGEDDAATSLTEHVVVRPVSSANRNPYDAPDSVAEPQLRTAGLMPEEEFEIPPPPFPHAPARVSKANFNHGKVQEELAGLNAPLFIANTASKSQPVDGAGAAPALRKNHLAILTAVMHHCLLEGDYQRAGRAWGMLLRTRFAGQQMDPRYHGRWGIGAEILLRRSTQDPSQISDAADEASNETDVFSEEGFELAREYYERLIVQHPNRKTHPQAVDDRTFYPAMFSVWISQVRERSRQDVLVERAAILDEELRRAREIAERMDQIIISPPFDKQGNLLELRGMVSLWMSDLIMGNTATEETDDWNFGYSAYDNEVSSEPSSETRKKKMASTSR
ncbi:hypothetical protein BS50DRAFT_609391 [Corynespora cassiicola Philippines]|uniref:Uncharacterized protein n=1 Tax=Corynespora cassiicola Philippines TaxID=1448308 RepID=A0A2T2NV50_CORCC|nr:hypothetical protein BS50DRAFT_609391 [Corynespora cassiicola Philippines]